MLFAGCKGGSGLGKLPLVTPAQDNSITSHVKATDYFVVMHPGDAPDIATLRTIHDQWHARGIRMDYMDDNPALCDHVRHRGRESARPYVDGASIHP